MADHTDDEVREFIIRELSDVADLKPEEIVPDATLEHLDIDSLDLVEVAQIIEERYDVRLEREDFKDVRTVGEAIDVIVCRCIEAPAG